jgi:hypothetical protein
MLPNKSTQLFNDDLFDFAPLWFTVAFARFCSPSFSLLVLIFSLVDFATVDVAVTVVDATVEKGQDTIIFAVFGKMQCWCIFVESSHKICLLYVS